MLIIEPTGAANLHAVLEDSNMNVVWVAVIAVTEGIGVSLSLNAITLARLWPHFPLESRYSLVI